MAGIEQIEWRVEAERVPYRRALAEMEARNEAIAAGDAREMFWMLEHPPVYTAGTSAAASELLDPRFEVIEAGRGGRYTYHGPGQRVTYVLLDLRERGKDVRRFVHALEDWVAATLGQFGVESWTVPERARSQDRRDRCARAPLGDNAWIRGEPVARSFALLGYRPVRNRRIRRHQPGRSRHRSCAGCMG